MARSMAKSLTAIPETLKQSVDSTLAVYRQLGNSGLRISNPVFGGLQIGSSRWLPWVQEEENVRISGL
jgi:hypothetical protein